MNTNTEIQTTTQISCNEKTATVCTVTYKKALPQKTPSGTAKKTSSKRQGKWIFNVPGERVKLVADSRQARSMVGMLMNPLIEVDPEDVDEWAERGPCIIRHMPIPERGQTKNGDINEHGDTSGDDEEDDTTNERVAPEDDKVPGLSRKDKWQSPLPSDYWTHVHGLQSPHTGTIGDECVVREIDRQKKSLKAAIDLMQGQRHPPQVKIAKFQNLLTELQKHRSEYVQPITGKNCPPRYRLFYPKATENLLKSVRVMLLRAIRSSVASDSQAKGSLLNAINRGTHLGYTPDASWDWQVTPFDLSEIPHLPNQAANKAHKQASKQASNQEDNQAGNQEDNQADKHTDNQETAA